MGIESGLLGSLPTTKDVVVTCVCGSVSMLWSAPEGLASRLGRTPNSFSYTRKLCWVACCRAALVLLTGLRCPLACNRLQCIDGYVRFALALKLHSSHRTIEVFFRCNDIVWLEAFEPLRQSMSGHTSLLCCVHIAPVSHATCAAGRATPVGIRASS